MSNKSVEGLKMLNIETIHSEGNFEFKIEMTEEFENWFKTQALTTEAEIAILRKHTITGKCHFCNRSTGTGQVKRSFSGADKPVNPPKSKPNNTQGKSQN